jgi:GTPase SAR1 family protein
MLVHSLSMQERHLATLQDECPDARAVLVGNKVDKAENRMVTHDAAAVFASSNDMLYFEISAKTGENVLPLFEHVVERLHSTFQET